MAKEDPPKYETCGVTITVKYLLIECCEYSKELDKYKIPNTQDVVLGPYSENIHYVSFFLINTKL